MWKDVLLLTLSCVLFVQMGLSGAIQEALHVQIKPLSCPKCLSFWAILAFLVLSGYGNVIEAMVASFLCSYLALWLSLAYDAVAIIYNKLYEYLSEASDTSEDSAAHSGEPAPGNADEVSEV